MFFTSKIRHTDAFRCLRLIDTLFLWFQKGGTEGQTNRCHSGFCNRNAIIRQIVWQILCITTIRLLAVTSFPFMTLQPVIKSDPYFQTLIVVNLFLECDLCDTVLSAYVFTKVIVTLSELSVCITNLLSLIVSESTWICSETQIHSFSITIQVRSSQF